MSFRLGRRHSVEPSPTFPASEDGEASSLARLCLARARARARGRALLAESPSRLRRVVALDEGFSGTTHAYIAHSRTAPRRIPTCGISNPHVPQHNREQRMAKSASDEYTDVDFVN